MKTPKRGANNSQATLHRYFRPKDAAPLPLADAGKEPSPITSPECSPRLDPQPDLEPLTPRFAAPQPTSTPLFEPLQKPKSTERQASTPTSFGGSNAKVVVKRRKTSQWFASDFGETEKTSNTAKEPRDAFAMMMKSSRNASTPARADSRFSNDDAGDDNDNDNDKDNGLGRNDKQSRKRPNIVIDDDDDDDDYDDDDDNGQVEGEDEVPRTRTRSNAHSKQRSATTTASAKSSTSTSAQSTSTAAAGKGAPKYTPLEKQYLAIKANHPDTLLAVEVGYKFKFFDSDARIAAKVLNIMCYKDKNFEAASIPTHRLMLHVRRLMYAGHKVGVVRQAETAALKSASGNKSGPFARELSEIYTRCTLVEEIIPSQPVKSFRGGANDKDDDDDEDDNDDEVAGSVGLPAANIADAADAFMLCIIEDHQEPNTSIGILAVSPSSGDIIFDEFVDNPLRVGLETHLANIRPFEILYSADSVSSPTLSLIEGYQSRFAHNNDVSNATVRLIKLSSGDVMETPSSAATSISRFYNEQRSNFDIAAILALPPLVLCCISTMMQYLSSLKLSYVFLPIQLSTTTATSSTASATASTATTSTSNSRLVAGLFIPFAMRQTLTLDSSTLHHLEIFENQTTHTVSGSLLWTIDHTRTGMGKRLLRKWVRQPLCDLVEIRKRHAAVDAIIQACANPVAEISGAAEKMRKALVGLVDVERGLCRILYKRCTTAELAALLVAMKATGSVAQKWIESYAEVDDSDDDGTVPSALAEYLQPLADAGETVSRLIESVDIAAAKRGDKEQLFTSGPAFDEISGYGTAIANIEQELDDHLVDVRKQLRRSTLEYVTVSGISHMIAVPVKVISGSSSWVPKDWVRISATKQVVRFHTPLTVRKLAEREQARERRKLAAERWFIQYQADMAQDACFGELRAAAASLGVLDCLISLADVARRPGYVRPTFIDATTDPRADAGGVIDIVGGRHPVLERVSSDVYVANDVQLSSSAQCALVLTGPNMGGKSSLARMTGLLAIMAHIGCYIPADSATFSVLDGVYTRIGASDRVFAGQSTFMVEMVETERILAAATSNSLLILDELGRGTSTHDGQAIAHAVLEHCAVNTGALVLFVTHYSGIARGLTQQYSERIKACFMDHIVATEAENENGVPQVTFLYKAVEGTAPLSFGTNVARMAGLPESVLKLAQVKARELERTEMERSRVHELCKFAKIAQHLKRAS